MLGCNRVMFGPTKLKVRTALKLDRQTDVSPTLQRTCHPFGEALNKVSSNAIKRTFNTLRTAIPSQLRHKSASNYNATITGQSSSQP